MLRRRKWLAVGLVTVMMILAVGCGQNDSPSGDVNKGGKRTGNQTATPANTMSEDLTKSSSLAAPDANKLAEAFFAADDFQKGIRVFAANLLAKSYNGETIMVSPFSLYAALGMVACGAEGKTLEEMEALFGCSAETLANVALYLNMKSEEANVVRMANSIWLNSGVGFTAKEDFLKTCGTYYRSAVMKAPFSSPKTLEEINAWVKDKSKGRIDKILDALSDEQVMVLINALTFDGTWRDPFDESRTEKEAKFYQANGNVKPVDMMRGEADDYFEDQDMVGFVKCYRDGYLFRAYMPKDGRSVSDIMNKLKENPELPYQTATQIYIGMPKFKESSSVSLNDILKDLGMKKAFMYDAEFGKMSDTQVYISKVIQKTYIEVDETGTKAAAVTGITVDANCIMEEVIRQVTLDHPFVYEIVDASGNIPLFIGVYE